jgi:NADH:quinone reductase (non-electrogenic)
MSGSSDQRPRVVIVGAGFGGLWAARGLARSGAAVTLVDRNNYHTFLPLLYQVAASELSPTDIAFPIRSILRELPHARFVLGEVKAIDPDACEVRLAERDIPYDFLVLAVGSTSTFFGIPGAAEHAFPLKTLEQGIALRNRILRCFERAAEEPDARRREQILTFAIVGGGPTGVEFAGALAELIRGAICKDYAALDLREVHIVLIEALDRLLAALPVRLGDYARRRLEQMGVQVRLRAAVSAISDDAVYLKGSAAIPAETVVWTAGVRGAGEDHAFGLTPTRSGQFQVLPTLQVTDYPHIYVVGDLAQVGRLPMIAPVAIQEGAAAARNITHQLNAEPPEPFNYRDRGTMTTIGRNAAVAYIWGRTFTGFSAWLIWLGVHIYNLVGFRNRLIVLINWAWDYFFFERGVRLILPDTRKSTLEHAGESMIHE